MRDRAQRVNSEERKKRVAQRLSGHAYLLLEVMPGTSDRVAETLVKLNSSAVPYAAAVWGPWDVVARVTLKNPSELLEFVDDLQSKTKNRIIRTETWCIRSDQEHGSSIEKLDQLAFVMLRVDPRKGDLKKALNFVYEPPAANGDAKVLHAAGVLGPYDIATTVGYSSDVALTDLVMNHFQDGGSRFGITNTLTIPSIVGMLYPDGGRRTHHLSEEAIRLAAFGVKFRDNFSDAAKEVEQARRCYAHGLFTACVFHLMRATELGLNAVFKSLHSKKDAGQNWGKILGDMKKEIDQRNWDDPERKMFFDSVHALLTSFKESWRNPTMHPEYSYDESLARNAFDGVRGFMFTISSRMNQKGDLVG
jgi:hypothetical protein